MISVILHDMESAAHHAGTHCPTQSSNLCSACVSFSLNLSPSVHLLLYLLLLSLLFGSAVEWALQLHFAQAHGTQDAAAVHQRQDELLPREVVQMAQLHLLQHTTKSQ